MKNLIFIMIGMNVVFRLRDLVTVLVMVLVVVIDRMVAVTVLIKITTFIVIEM